MKQLEQFFIVKTALNFLAQPVRYGAGKMLSQAANRSPSFRTGLDQLKLRGAIHPRSPASIGTAFGDVNPMERTILMKTPYFKRMTRNAATPGYENIMDMRSQMARLLSNYRRNPTL